MLWMYITEVIGFLSKFKNNRTPVEIYSVAKKNFSQEQKPLFLRILSFISLSIIEIVLLYKLGARPIKGSPSFYY